MAGLGNLEEAGVGSPAGGSLAFTAVRRLWVSDVTPLSDTKINKFLKMENEIVSLRPNLRGLPSRWSVSDIASKPAK